MTPWRLIAGTPCILMSSLAAATASEPFLKGKPDAALLQSWTKVLDKSSGKDTPVSRVVGLLNDMAKTLQDDMDKDEAQYNKLSCWCDQGKYDKTQSSEASSAKVQQLQDQIQQLSARADALTTNIKDLNEQVATGKQGLDEASALREKELQEFHDYEKDSIQALENLKAAIKVLSKHHDEGSAPKSSVGGGAVFKTEKDRWLLLATGSWRNPLPDLKGKPEENEKKKKDGEKKKKKPDPTSFLALRSRSFPWEGAGPEEERRLDNFMRDNDLVNTAAIDDKPVSKHDFLQTSGQGAESSSNALSTEEDMIVQRALKAGNALLQARQGSSYRPAYQSQSGEIFGILQTMNDELKEDLAEAQKREATRAADFHELRAAKEQELENGYKMSEKKEDEHAETVNLLAEAKEDLGQEDAVLAETIKFLANLKETCAGAAKAFNKRKVSRMEEMKAVAETIEILQGDEARDAMTGTFNGFVQVRASHSSTLRERIAEKLRKASRELSSPQLSVLATSVQLDAFTKVKEAINKMIDNLKVQLQDEVKKNDWCKSEIHQNEMSLAKSRDKEEALEGQIEQLEVRIQEHTKSVEDAKKEIGALQLALQRASEDRKEENLEFQKTITDQTTTIVILKKALDRLSKYYDFAQVHATSHQTPPVPQMEYEPSAGSSGVMQMIEKLVYDAKDLMKEAVQSESEAQVAYEMLIQETNGSVDALQGEIVKTSKARATAKKDHHNTKSDHADTVEESQGLEKYIGDVRGDCKFLMDNFDVRQSGMQSEIESLKEALSILSGASSA